MASQVYGGVLLVLGLLLILFEAVVVVYAVKMAVNCSANGPDRVVSVGLALLFPLPYVFFSSLLNPCAKATLKKW